MPKSTKSARATSPTTTRKKQKPTSLGCVGVLLVNSDDEILVTMGTTGKILVSTLLPLGGR